MFSNKKGISEVVTVLLIVLLVLAAIAIVWQVVMPLINKTANEVTAGCVALNLNIESAICAYDNESNAEIAVTLKRNTGGDDIKSLNFIVYDTQNSMKFLFGDESIDDIDGEIPQILEKKTFTIYVTNLSETLTPEDISKIAIAPVIPTDSGDKLCGEIASKTIKCEETL